MTPERWRERFSRGWPVSARIRRLAVCGAGALATILIGQRAQAQAPDPSPAAMGTGQNYVARAMGFAAIGLNPARLGMKERPSWSLAVPGVAAAFGLEPVGLTDIGRYSGERIPDETRREWLQRITDRGGQTGLTTVSATAVSATMGRFGVQVSSQGIFRGDMNEDAAEIALFGNSGRTGIARVFRPESSAVDAFWVSSVTAVGAFPLSLDLGGGPDRQLAVGVAVSLLFGHTALVSREVQGILEDDPPSGDIAFPSIQTTETRLNNGFGVGLGISAAWESGPWAVGANVENLVNTFEWELDDLVFRRGEAGFDLGSAHSSFVDLAVGLAPAPLREAIEASDYDPVVTVGGAYEVTPSLTLLADYLHRFGSGLPVTPTNRLGAGVEWGTTRWLTLRGGGSWVTDGFRVGAGAGVRAGPVNVSGAYLYQGGPVGSADVLSLALSFGAQ